MADRYFVETPIRAEKVVLTGAEAHHVLHVMRARRGDRVVLFDGSGAEFQARVEQLGRNDATLTVLAREEIDRELPFALTLGVALPKGERQKWLVEKAVELGVAKLAPLKTQWAVALPGQAALERMRRAVIEASKQCGRNRLMEIAEPRSFLDFVEDTKGQPCRLLAHPGGMRAADVFAAVDHAREGAILAVGPEGGFTDEEISLAVSAGWRAVDLGPRILRVETAAIMLAALAAGRL